MDTRSPPARTVLPGAPMPGGPGRRGRPLPRHQQRSAGSAVRRRRTRTGVVLALSLAAHVLTPAVLGRVSGDQAFAGPVHAVSSAAPVTAGWGASYVDDRGQPGRWDPCRRIGYVVNEGWLPPGGRDDLAAALAQLSVASGLRFVDEGRTDEVPSRGRAAYQPARYGRRWAPLLLAWVPPASTDLGLGDGVQGVTMATALPAAGGPSIVTAQVALDADAVLPAGFGPGVTDGEVLLHELTHAVGLGHVLDPTQVMYPQTTEGESAFGAGDRAGLAAVGVAAGCHQAPTAQSLLRRTRSPVTRPPRPTSTRTSPARVRLAAPNAAPMPKHEPPSGSVPTTTTGRTSAAGVLRQVGRLL